MNVRISMGVYDGMWKIERKAGEGWTAHPAGVGYGGVMAYHASHAGTHHDTERINALACQTYASARLALA